MVGELGTVLDRVAKGEDAGLKLAELVRSAKKMASLRTEVQKIVAVEHKLPRLRGVGLEVACDLELAVARLKRRIYDDIYIKSLGTYVQMLR